jgi:hypothetical protein
MLLELTVQLCHNHSMTSDEEQRKATFEKRSQAIIAAIATVFFNGDEDAAWREAFTIEDSRPRANVTRPQEPTAARIHLKATH